MLLRLQILRVEALHLQARTALASAQSSRGDKRERLYRIAEKIARRIARERMPWSDPFAALIRAAVASAHNDRQRAVLLLSEAMDGFDLADMTLYAVASRRRLGQVMGGERGAGLLTEANEWMRDQDVKNPVLMTQMLAPGWENG